MKDNILSIGHRGAKGHITENTIKSIKKALALGVDAIELDVHLCASGELVVFHDFTVDRLTNGSGEVSKLSLSELKKLKVNREYKIPTLIEALETINRKCLLNIELKGKETAIETCRIIKRYVDEKEWKYKDFIVSSFQQNLLKTVYSTNSKIPIGVLIDVPLDIGLQFAEVVKAKAIHPDYTLLTMSNVKKIKEKGYKVYTWTVNEIEAIQRMKTYKVDGIITDFPDRL